MNVCADDEPSPDYDASLEIPRDAGMEPTFRVVPELPGVAVFEAADGRAVLIATTRNLRELARRRLAPQAIEPSDKPVFSVNYRDITASVRVRIACTSVEADLAYLGEARRRLPHAHRVVFERWRPWFVTIDPDSEHPEWGKTNLSGSFGKARALGKRAGAAPLPRGLSVDPTRLIGPIADKDAAGRVIELAIDGFDLCRYHHLLEQSPRAQACAYKEMGRCPAPCDGSESLADYRDRVREAEGALRAGARSRAIERLQNRLREAAERHDYESAARTQRALAAVERMGVGGLANVERMSDWRGVIVARAGGGRAAVLVWCRLRLVRVVDVCVEAGKQAVQEAMAAVDAALGARCPMPAIEGDSLDAIAVVSRFVLSPAKKRSGVWIRAEELGIDTLARAVKSVCKPATNAEQTGVSEQAIDPV